MPANTTPDGVPYPLASDAIKDGAAAIQTLAQWVDDLFVQDLRSNRPAFGKPGRRFWGTDTMSEFLDTGTTWRRLGLPAGSVVWFSGATVPAGFLEANGQEVSRIGVGADLWEYMATTHGGGSQVDLYKLPDLNGRTAIGRTPGRAAGTKVGSETVTLTPGQMPGHTHNLPVVANNGTDLGLATQLGTIAQNFPTYSAGGNQGHDNMQPSTVGVYGVKL